MTDQDKEDIEKVRERLRKWDEQNDGVDNLHVKEGDATITNDEEAIKQAQSEGKYDSPDHREGSGPDRGENTE